MAGRVVKCSKCSTQLKIPGGAPASGVSPSAAPTPAAPKSVFDDSDPFADLPTSSPAANAGNPGGAGAFPAAPAPGGYNPYAPPPARKSKSKRGGAQRGNSSGNYTIPGLLILLWSALGIIVGIFQIGMVVYVIATGQIDMQQVDMPRFLGQMTGRVFAICLFGVMATGGFAMMQRQNLGTAKAAAVLAAIPCFGCFVFPFGIWACVQLFSDKAERDFR
ncbi:hypothetical protein [Stieleria marina]